jgi:hypothetical protein
MSLWLISPLIILKSLLYAVYFRLVLSVFQPPSSKSDKTKSKAYLVYAEWGPDRRIPRDVRLAACFPALTVEERAEWLALFDAVEREIWRYAQTGNARLHPFLRFAKHMRERFPFMNYAALRKAWGLAVYDTIHEGY